MISHTQGNLIKALVSAGVAVPEENLKCDEPEAADEEGMPDVVEARLKGMAVTIAELTSRVNVNAVTIEGLEAKVESLVKEMAERDSTITMLMQEVAALKELLHPRAVVAARSHEKAASSPAPAAPGLGREPTISKPLALAHAGLATAEAVVVDLFAAPATAQAPAAHADVATGVQEPHLINQHPVTSRAGPGKTGRDAELGEAHSERTAFTGGRPRSSNYTGVRLDPDTGKWVAAIGLTKGRSYSTPLGSWDSELEAAEAYAAAAAVLRKDWRPPRGEVITLKLADRANIEKMTHAEGTALLKARAWHKWRTWREELYPTSVLAGTAPIPISPPAGENAASERVPGAPGKASAMVEAGAREVVPGEDVAAAEAVIASMTAAGGNGAGGLDEGDRAANPGSQAR
ncbi:unnamed protein product [Closterium sp. Yama58-4]|nr:unnamed protein product [Closterium sp. Yama58-4]